MNTLPWKAALILGVASAGAGSEAPEIEFFEKKIRPVLTEQCFECHSAASPKIKGGLRVDSRAALLRGGELGPAIVPGQPEASLLVAAMAHRNPDLTMPPKKPKLPDTVIADVERWIREGALWPGTETEAGSETPDAFDLKERKRRLAWLWEVSRRQTPPSVNNRTWPLNPVDQFILARLEQEGLPPAPPAEPGIWLRRVYFALIGLPPSPEELAAFLKNPASAAREQVVDHLLASPHFGERWARHWLDLVRYAESRGHESDFIIPNAYEYRDYVVRALNADVPYDAFVREHLAGDRLPQPRRHPEQGFNESILGTGWAFLGEEIHAPVDTRQDETDRIDNRLDVLSKAFLGLTVSCARCHDHKFDAISQRDYYALAGFFISTGQRLARFETLEQEREAARELAELRARWEPTIKVKVLAAQSPVLARLRDYLTAAAQATQAETKLASPSGHRFQAQALPRAISETSQRLASEQSLDGQVLSQWTTAVLNALGNPEDPLHALAVAAIREPKPPVSVQKDWAHNETGLPAKARVLVDFGKLTSQEWFADGAAFGLRPVQAGEMRPVAPSGTNSPSLRLATRTAAEADPDWRTLDLAAGVEREPTVFGNWKRDGAMLRLPKFELGNGKLHYLVRGAGRIFAAVDSQRLVTGPLHTVLAREWSYQNRWHWVSHDLSEYQGHRVAIEFSPGDEFDTAIALVIESETTPTEPMSLGQWMAESLAQRPCHTLADLAAAYQQLFSMAADSLNATSADTPLRELARWLIERPELFSGKSGEWPAIVTESMRGYSMAREPITSRIPWKSRTAPAMMEGNGVEEYLLVRGKHQTPKGLVPRRFLEAIAGPEPISSQPGSGRWELAEAITAPTNPLIARVLVNRVWHHLFGRGIVATVDNFGWLGQRPTHPELLDTLAATFIQEDGWSLKRLIRRLVLTQTYAMISTPTDPLAEQRDPENLLLHRMNLKRLEGEAIRDAMLAVSGRLDRHPLGPSVPLHPSQFVEARGLRGERGPLDGDGRRSLYVAARRNFLPMMMTVFDTPTPFTTVGRRNVSNVPGQMLFLMNDPFVHQQAELWAKRLVLEIPGAPPEERIRRLYRAAFSRDPSAAELARCRATLTQLEATNSDPSAQPNAWAEVCHAFLGVKEFIYVR